MSEYIVVTRHQGPKRLIIHAYGPAGPKPTAIRTARELRADPANSEVEVHVVKIIDVDQLNRESEVGIVTERPVCEWYAACDNPADGLALHPIIGPVPTCGRCAKRHDLFLRPLPQETGGGE